MGVPLGQWEGLRFSEKLAEVFREVLLNSLEIVSLSYQGFHLFLKAQPFTPKV